MLLLLVLRFGLLLILRGWAAMQPDRAAAVAAAAAFVVVLAGSGLAAVARLAPSRLAPLLLSMMVLGLTRSLGPDVIIVDADVPAALALVEALLDDPLTDAVPILVVGTFSSSEQAARFVALGVSKTIPKPISPEALRASCDEAISDGST